MRPWRHWNTQTLMVGTENAVATLENSLAIPQKKLNIESPSDLSILLLGSDPRETETYVHIKTCAQIFVASSFTVALQCLSLDRNG